MDWQEESINKDYRCAKCRNRKAIVRKITLGKGRLPEMLIRGGGKYRFITCTLCGYTEIYDLSVYAENRVADPQKDQSVNLAPET